jgi:hypothetical protein
VVLGNADKYLHYASNWIPCYHSHTPTAYLLTDPRISGTHRDRLVLHLREDVAKFGSEPGSQAVLARSRADFPNAGIW